VSPLLQFKAYRMQPGFGRVGGSHPDPRSPTLCNALDASWPLCMFDVRGSCKDMRCRMQHLQDGELSLAAEQGARQAAVAAAAGAQPITAAARSSTLIAAELAGAQAGVGEQLRHRGRVAQFTPAMRLAVGLEGHVPQYARTAWEGEGVLCWAALL
jgi:hypothetical protein